MLLLLFYLADRLKRPEASVPYCRSLVVSREAECHGEIVQVNSKVNVETFLATQMGNAQTQSIQGPSILPYINNLESTPPVPFCPCLGSPMIVLLPAGATLVNSHL